MDKKYIADKRNKSKKYKNNKYIKKEEHNKSGTDNNQKLKSQEDVIPNNWSRYELTNDNDSGDEVTCIAEGANYETLLLAPVSVDSHFKFKSEQNWDEDVKSQVDLSKYFTLNIALLNEGISCVPFIKRQGYDESIISPPELEKMKTTSESNLEKYKQLLEQKFPPTNDIIITKSCDIIKRQISKELSEAVTNKKQNDKIISEIKNIKINSEPTLISQDDDVDDLLNLKCSDLAINDEPDIKVEDPLLEKTEIGKVIAPQPAVDLEQWLDDILDD